jgi:hypothetical protein
MPPPPPSTSKYNGNNAPSPMCNNLTPKQCYCLVDQHENYADPQKDCVENPNVVVPPM